jgi:hypothetical protein
VNGTKLEQYLIDVNQLFGAGPVVLDSLNHSLQRDRIRALQWLAMC